MKIELVGGPLCGRVENMVGLPPSITRDYSTGYVGEAWQVSYVRTNEKMHSSRNNRYVFAGQTPASAS